MTAKHSAGVQLYKAAALGELEKCRHWGGPDVVLASDYDAIQHQLSAERAGRERAEANERRYLYLQARAHQKTAHDLFGDGGNWEVCVFSADQTKTLSEAIDAAMQKERG